MSAKLISRYIVTDPQICHGKLTFRGTRIMVWQMLDQVASGMAWETIVEEWGGSITKEAIAEFVRRLLRHPEFDTEAKRMGTVICLSHLGLWVWRLHAEKESLIGQSNIDEPMSREERCEVTYIDEDRVREASARLVDGLAATRLAETFKALSDPSRVRIISALSHAELCVCDLAATLGMSQSAVSHQLRTLRQLRLVKNRKEGRQVYYALDDDHIYELFRCGLDHVNHD